MNKKIIMKGASKNKNPVWENTTIPENKMIKYFCFEKSIFLR